MEQQHASGGSACPSCGRSDVGEGRFCRWCGQYLIAPEGIRAAGLGQRLLALVLDSILVPLTLFVGYLLWWLIVLDRGQTPGKQLVGIRAMGQDGSAVRWGWMFLREFGVKGIVFSLLAAFTISVVWVLDYLWAFWDRDRQTLHDKLVGTVVVQGPRSP